MKNKLVLVAVDPGAHGGIVVGTSPTEFTAIGMPELDGDRITWLQDHLKDARHCIAFIEQVGGYIAGNESPGSAMFNFGDNAGFIRGALMMAGARIEMVSPQKWQKFFNVRKPIVVGGRQSLTPARQAAIKREWKNRLKDRAQKLFPKAKVTLETADALLIYEYGTMTLANNFWERLRRGE